MAREGTKQFPFRVGRILADTGCRRDKNTIDGRDEALDLTVGRKFTALFAVFDFPDVNFFVASTAQHIFRVDAKGCGEDRFGMPGIGRIKFTGGGIVEPDGFIAAGRSYVRAISAQGYAGYPIRVLFGGESKAAGRSVENANGVIGASAGDRGRIGAEAD